jgi:hypothetical protein
VVKVDLVVLAVVVVQNILLLGRVEKELQTRVTMAVVQAHSVILRR